VKLEKWKYIIETVNILVYIVVTKKETKENTRITDLHDDVIRLQLPESFTFSLSYASKLLVKLFFNKEKNRNKEKENKRSAGTQCSCSQITTRCKCSIYGQPYPGQHISVLFL